MEYKLYIEEYFSQKQVYAVFYGEIDEKSRNEIIVVGLKFMREENIPNLLCDIREASVLYSLIGSHTIIEQIHHYGFKHTDHAAIVYTHNENQHIHADNVAFNKGLNIKYFKNDIEEARKWLLQFEK
ncbi:MAG: hypothetical protein PHT07_14660 [Paludibacter sp.]|nr:hypothetical protein [Paludibacter sp.]